MPIGHYFIRIIRYYKTNGFCNTAIHSLTMAKKVIFQNKFVLFYAELTLLKNEDFQLPEYITIECKKSEDEISENDINILTLDRGKDIIQHELKDRFLKEAFIWLIKVRGEFVGFIWSIKKTPVQPYFFPLTDYDVHLFDNEIFPKYRGQGINPVLINYLLYDLKRRGFVRAFMETLIWNSFEIRSLAKTHFRRLASARKFHLVGRDITVWSYEGD
jgi:GNAT superfamily N-acetyltransferase